MNSDGTNNRDISQHGTGEWRQPRWSKEGNKLLHVRFIGIGTTELFLMDSLGKNPIRLTNNAYDDWDPISSPDGNKIAWGSGGQYDSGIWLMNADGTNQHLLIKDGGYPTWSSDGKRIAFHKLESSAKFVVLWVINDDGTNLYQLTQP